MTTKVALVLSGCGVFDGAEIYESVLTLLRLHQRGANVQAFAPVGSFCLGSFVYKAQLIDALAGSRYDNKSSTSFIRMRCF